MPRTRLYYVPLAHVSLGRRHCPAAHTLSLWMDDRGRLALYHGLGAQPIRRHLLSRLDAFWWEYATCSSSVCRWLRGELPDHEGELLFAGARPESRRRPGSAFLAVQPDPEYVYLDTTRRDRFREVLVTYVSATPRERLDMRTLVEVDGMDPARALHVLRLVS